MDPFLDKDVRPALPAAAEFATKLSDFLKAKAELEEAKSLAAKQHYTGQYSHSDLVAEEQERYNRATEALYYNINGICPPTE